jgi:hypothetical protein
MRGWVDFGAVKRAVSLEAVLRHYQVQGLRKRGHQLVGRCPIHRGQRDDSFRASLSKNAFHCFACQAGGNVLNFVAAMEKCSIRQAALRLQGWFSVGAPGEGHPLGSARRSVRKAELVREKEGRNPPLPFVLTDVDHSHPYLVKRGVDPATGRRCYESRCMFPGALQTAPRSGQVAGHGSADVPEATTATRVQDQTVEQPGIGIRFLMRFLPPCSPFFGIAVTGTIRVWWWITWMSR